jgi:hypothetical protein
MSSFFLNKINTLRTMNGGGAGHGNSSRLPISVLSDGKTLLIYSWTNAIMYVFMRIIKNNFK